MPLYRVYADDTVVHEDDFAEEDNSVPYRDDYAVYRVPEGDEDVEYWDIPKVLKDHIINQCEED